MNQECVSSTIHRRALKSGLIAISFFSSPRGPICGIKLLPWATSSLPTYPASRHKWHSVVVGGETTAALSKGSRAMLSCWLAALTSSEMGMPFSSTRICHFEPFFPRSVGFGPVDSLASGASMLALSAACQVQAIPCSSSYSARPRCQILVNTPAILHCWNLS